ncbi:hypothetical protein ACOI1H_02465 [Loktanella sp. DJP18]|uniref:hypothetical protein n=1 Tax=Loktanella sp. DJP18 TaxID=3409788 RepID=UPI003BB637DF
MMITVQMPRDPVGSLWGTVRQVIETVFHIGAHRCATTTFQAYLDQNRQPLIRAGIMPWTPSVTREGLFDRLVRPPAQDDPGLDAQAARRIANRLSSMERRGVRQLLVSEENMIGTPRDNIARQALYPGLAARLARFRDAFGGRVDRIGLVIRGYEAFWASSIAFAVMAGTRVPGAEACKRIANQPRCWADVVCDLRRLCPDTPISVWTFEAFAGRPRRQLTMLSRDPRVAHMLDQTPVWANRSRDTDTLRDALVRQGRPDEAALIPDAPGAWMPFDAADRAALAALYADDLTYLRGQDDPLLTFTERTAIKIPSVRQRAQGA